MVKVESDFHRSIAWLTDDHGIYWNDTFHLRTFRYAVKHARAIAIDPGDPCGVACFAPGAPITLHQVSASTLARTLVIDHRGDRDLDLVCEQPLSGSVRVYDPQPLRVAGFVALWHSAMYYDDDDKSRYFSAPVGWLKAGKSLASIPDTAGISPHALDALRYGVMAVVTNATIHEHLRSRT